MLPILEYFRPDLSGGILVELSLQPGASSGGSAVHLLTTTNYFLPPVPSHIPSTATSTDNSTNNEICQLQSGPSPSVLSLSFPAEKNI